MASNTNRSLATKTYVRDLTTAARANIAAVSATIPVIAVQVISSFPAAVVPTNTVVFFDSDAVGNAVSLPDATNGQLITFLHRSETAGSNTVILTPDTVNTTFVSQATFDNGNSHDRIQMVFVDETAPVKGWIEVGETGVAVVIA